MTETLWRPHGLSSAWGCQNAESERPLPRSATSLGYDGLWSTPRQQLTARRNDRYDPPASQKLSQHFNRYQVSGHKRRMGTTEDDAPVRSDRPTRNR